MGKINSRAKGVRGELDLAHTLQSYGYDTRRGQQFSGAQGDADVVGLPYIHIECKYVEKLNISEAMAQSKRDTAAYMARTNEPTMPTVMHRRSREDWLVTMPLSFWIKLYNAYRKEVDHETHTEREDRGVSPQGELPDADASP